VKEDDGYVIDIGPVEGMNQAEGMYFWSETIFGVFNSDQGSEILRFKRLIRPYSGIQEWGFRKPEFEILWSADDDKVLSSVFLKEAGQLLFLTGKKLVKLEFDQEGNVETSQTETTNLLRLFNNKSEEVFAMDADGKIYQLDTTDLTLSNLNLSVPDFDGVSAVLPVGGKDVILGDGQGRAFRFNSDNKSLNFVFQTPVSLIKSFAGLLDKIVYIFYGDGIGRYGRFNLETGEFADLGCVVSVLETKRYAYTFACSVSGKDGEIYWGENDRNGHLWVYYPSFKLLT
jgi:hypothetical protein